MQMTGKVSKGGCTASSFVFKTGKPLLECCVDSVESALAAKRGGADRLELCGGLLLGGLSPSPCLFEEVKKQCPDIKIHVLLRPRSGDFCYSDSEFAVLKREIKLFCELGADGAVIGILKPDGTLNTEQMQELIGEASGMSLTLHRAVDMCRDPMEAMEQAIALGMHTILTSGQEKNALAGAVLIGRMIREAAGRIDIMPGAGVSAAVIPELYKKTKALSYHMSGKMVLDGAMQYRKEAVSMGDAFISEYEIIRTDEDKVAAAVRALEVIER